jgi:hypothetical protein
MAASVKPLTHPLPGAWSVGQLNCFGVGRRSHDAGMVDMDATYRSFARQTLSTESAICNCSCQLQFSSLSRYAAARRVD